MIRPSATATIKNIDKIIINEFSHYWVPFPNTRFPKPNFIVLYPIFFIKSTDSLVINYKIRTWKHMISIFTTVKLEFIITD